MRDLVTKAGFDFAQGYLFGKPEKDITSYWRKLRSRRGRKKQI
jgi:EAL domain-containing protein (putative c-di-GMP-specific phosphodiesterase class I)